MKRLYFLSVLFLSLLISGQLRAQCNTWAGLVNEEDVKGWHSVYRHDLKVKQFEKAFPNWQKAYEAAPAADGKRDFHFTDGIKFFKRFYKEEQDPAKKKEYKEKIIALYDQCVECYRQRAIKVKNCTDEVCINQRIGFLRGREAFDMYYDLQVPYTKTYEVGKKSLELSGLNAEYILVVPLTNIMINLFLEEKLSVEEVRETHTQLLELCDHNIANNKQYGIYYDQAMQNMEVSIKKIESMVYDCRYFKDKLLPQYEADPDNGELIKEIYNKLLREGCDKEEPIMQQLEQKYETYAIEVNKQLQAELEAKNPAIAGKRLYDEGKYLEAIKKYEEAIEKEEDNEKMGEFYFRIASIEGRKLERYSSARSNALNAAKLRPNWGQPYMLIGDLYAITSRSCGDSFQQRLAVLAALDKYYQAKKIDEEVAAEANEKIARYSNSKPDKEAAFMMGYKEGQVLKVQCWIGEQVRLRF